MQSSIASNFSWRFGGVLTKALIQFVTTILLSHLLPVSAFGALTYAMIFIGLTTIFVNLGVGPAIIQRTDLDEIAIHTASTFSIIVGVGATLVLYSIASFISTDTSTIQVIRTLSLLFIITSSAIVPEALLYREGNFRSVVYAEVTAYFIGYMLISVCLAYMGWGTASLAYGVLFNALIRSAILFWYKRKAFKFAWSNAHLKNILAFGSGVTASTIFNFSAQNGDYFIAGRLLGAEPLALYARAYYMVRLPTDLVNISLHTVLFPRFSRAKHDMTRLGQIYLRAVSTSVMITLPMMMFLALIAPELIRLLFGERWLGTVQSLQILTGIGVLGLFTISDALLKATGQLRIQLLGQICYAVMVVVGVILGSRIGITGIALGVLLANSTAFLYLTYVSLKLLQIEWQKFIVSLVPVITVSSLIGAIGWILRYLMIDLGGSAFSILSIETLYWCLMYLLCLTLPIPLFAELQTMVSHGLAPFGAANYFSWFRVRLNESFKYLNG